jgi:signal transduction histidine kinase
MRSGWTGLAGAAMFVSGAVAAEPAGAGWLEAFLPWSTSAAFVAAAAFAAIFGLRNRSLKRTRKDQEQKIAALETALNDLEAVLTAEPHILLIWRGREAAPDRIAGDMKGAARIPATNAEILQFEGWLERESAQALTHAIGLLRERGTAFNIGIRTRTGDLLEADGRAAGGMATVRLRPLAGERREVTELASDARKLGRQVRRLSGLLELAPLPIWLRSADGRLAWVNAAYARAVEAPDGEAAIASGLEIADYKKLEAPPAGAAPGLLGRGHAVIGGAKRALDVYEIAIAEGTAGFAFDMTSLEEARRELKRHIDAHAKTLDRLDTAIAIFGPDQRLRSHNPAYEKLWDLDPDWLASSPTDGEILDRLRARRLLPEQANYRAWRTQLLKVYTTIEPYDDHWHLPDGRAVHVVCEQHPFGGVTWLYENATREFQLESQYNELFGVQRETLDNLREGIALFGTNGRIKLHNPAFARFWGLNAEWLASEPPPHIGQIVEAARKLHDDELHWDEIIYAATGLDSARKPTKGRISRNDGLTLEFASVPLPDGNTLLTYMDVTDSSRIENALRERAEALEAADRLKTGFMSNVSYQLRTPLTNILGYAEAMTLGIAGELQSKQHEYLRHIQTSSQDLLAIINGILDLTTVDAGVMEIKTRDVDVGDLIEAVTRQMAERAAKRSLTLSTDVARDVGSFSADPERVKQILTQLLDNAIGFTDPGGAVRIGARREGGEMVIWVSDTGRGIEPEFQKQVFDRFQAKHMPGGHRGAGLGLAIVKSFVELHGGFVSLKSELGKGTTVTCRFPAARAKAAE